MSTRTVPAHINVIVGKTPRTAWRRLEEKIEERWWSRELEYRIKPTQDPSSSWPERVFPGGWYFVEVDFVCIEERKQELIEWMESSLGFLEDADYAIVVIGEQKYFRE